MGAGRFDAGAYRSFAATARGKSVDDIYTSRNMNKNLDPKGVKIRESRDSADNPNSTPIIVAIDVTGSMGRIAGALAKEGLGTLFGELLDRKPVSDPHLMFMAVGDASSDSAPLQVSQFEADNRIVEQLTQIFVEGNGGGNMWESYNLPWYFAARHTEHDSLSKRGKRGYLFTVGDELPPHPITKDQIKHFIGDEVESDIETAAILAEAQRMYDVFHVIIAEGSHSGASESQLREGWGALLDQHTIWLPDHTKLSEVIVGAIQVREGGDAPKRFGTVVEAAVKHLPRNRAVAALPAHV